MIAKGPTGASSEQTGCVTVTSALDFGVAGENKEPCSTEAEEGIILAKAIGLQLDRLSRAVCLIHVYTVVAFS